ncbi:MAG: hypothetical protein WAW41_05725 [Methylobacter sp.]
MIDSIEETFDVEVENPVVFPSAGFRQFSLRGLDAVTGEWKLVTMAFNLKRMQVLAAG